MRVVVVGNGKMGSLIKETCEKQGHEVVFMVGPDNHPELEDVKECEMVIDFSHRDNLEMTCAFVKSRNAALVYGTTGLSEEQKGQLAELAKTNPVFYSTNYSYGVAVFEEILKFCTPLLEDSFDMELVETHHNQKVDAPSGTAKTILSILNHSGEFKEVYGREGMVGARQKEIGVHALRGGTEAGEHTVHYFGDNESITITHHATNRQIFVNGAVKAANWLVDKPAGLYNMNDLIKL